MAKLNICGALAKYAKDFYMVYPNEDVCAWESPDAGDSLEYGMLIDGLF
jgi:hypothetical protein